MTQGASPAVPAPAPASKPRPKRKSQSKFFFIRRRPHLRGIEREWERPPDDEYARELRDEGFVSITLLNRSVSNALKGDCRELEEHLLPHFWRLNQRAKFYQNRFYLYQWIFILAAFLTTALGATSVFIHSLDSDPAIGPLSVTGAIGAVTALISGLAATASFLIANESPQKQWFKARTQAESLRSLYFLFLARVKPFDQAESRERVQQLRLRVLDVLKDTGRRESNQ